MNPDKRKAYERHIMNVVIDRDILETARNEGQEKGLQEGVQKRIQKGIQKGKMDVIKNSLQQGLDLTIIASITGLSVEEIQEIRDNL